MSPSKFQFDYTAPAKAIVAFAGAFALGGCGLLSDGDSLPAEQLTQQREADAKLVQAIPQASLQAAQDCLVVIWDEQKNPDRDFDRAHDDVTGGAISCATGTSASEFETALTAIRAAAAANDREALIRELNIPLLYIDNAGNRRDLPEQDLVDAGFEEIFSDEMLGVMQNLELADMTVVPDQGAYFELGSLWLVANAKGGRPRLVTVNRQALDESIQAARTKADRPVRADSPERAS